MSILTTCWPGELTRRLDDCCTATHWQFRFYADQGSLEIVTTPIPKTVDPKEALALAFHEMRYYLCQCPRCHEWVSREDGCNPLHSLCHQCVSNIRQGLPLKNLGEDMPPRHNAFVFYSAFLGKDPWWELAQLSPPSLEPCSLAAPASSCLHSA